MLRILGALAAAALLAPAAPPWQKLEAAQAAASATDKLIACYVPFAGSDNPEDSASAGADIALNSKEAAARYGEFFWVRITDKPTAKRIGAPLTGTHLVFTDPDGTSVGIFNLHSGGVAGLLKTLDDGKALYKSRSVTWFDGEPDEKADAHRRKLIIYAFLDDKEKSEKAVKALEHPWVARDHGRIILVRKLVLDSPLAKRFKVTSVPTFVFFDPTQKEGKEVVERKTGEITTRMIRAVMTKFFERVKKILEKGED
jgi:hypothetical protein